MGDAADGRTELMERVRRACIRAAVEAYEDAGVRGLCLEGRWEAAIAAVRGLDLEDAIRATAGGRTDEPTRSTS